MTTEVTGDSEGDCQGCDQGADAPVVTKSDELEAHARREAIVRVQDAVKWLLATIAAVATVLLAGISLSDLRDAQGATQVTALALATICVGLIVATLWNAGRVLVAKPLSVREMISMLPPPPGTSDARRRTGIAGVRRRFWNRGSDKVRLHLGATPLTRQNVCEWQRARDDTVRKLNAARRTLLAEGGAAPDDQTPPPLSLLQQEIDDYDAALNAVGAMVEYRAVKDAFNRTRSCLIGSLGSGYLALVVMILLTDSPSG